MSNLQTAMFMKNCTKACPHCQSKVSKIEGCNKMTCPTCGKYFCWSCQEKITGYNHFAENPECGDILDAQIQDELNEEDLLSSTIFEMTDKNELT